MDQLLSCTVHGMHGLRGFDLGHLPKKRGIEWHAQAQPNAQANHVLHIEGSFQ